MKLVYLTTALIGGLVSGLVTVARYGPLAREVPQLLAASDPSAGLGAVSSQAWVGPSPLIPGVVLVLGIVAGWLATRGGAMERWAGARVAAAGGFGALVVVTALFTVMIATLGADPVVQAFVQASEPHPEARIASDMIPWLGAGIGALLGLAIGAGSWAAAIFGGAVVDVLREQSAAVHA